MYTVHISHRSNQKKYMKKKPYSYESHSYFGCNQNMYTLDSGINVAPGIAVVPLLKNFHITILLLFYINLGIAVIFFLQN